MRRTASYVRVVLDRPFFFFAGPMDLAKRAGEELLPNVHGQAVAYAQIGMALLPE
ncbi:MAG TPA: hypothetical protein VEQ84_04620 [Vicinamibacteria bacterium]|nr:hypothetical protein [Vicinamibacteria bacterium]